MSRGKVRDIIDPLHVHIWKSKSCDALLGYYCECGIEDWHNEHNPELRRDWFNSRITFQFIPVINLEWLRTNFFIYHKWTCSYIDMVYWADLLVVKEFLFIMGQIFGIANPHAFNLLGPIHQFEERMKV